MIMMLFAALGLAEPISLTYQIDNQIGIWYEGLAGTHNFSQSNLLWSAKGYSTPSHKGYKIYSFYEGIYFRTSPLEDSTPITQKIEKNTSSKDYKIVTDKKSHSTIVFIRDAKKRKHLVYRGKTGIEKPIWIQHDSYWGRGGEYQIVTRLNSTEITNQFQIKTSSRVS